MFFGLILYNMLSGLLFLIGFPFLILYNLAQGKYSGPLLERMGRYPRHLRTPKKAPQRRPIWVHAVSVGEIKAAVSLLRKIKAYLPDVPFLVSTTTPAGRETAEALLGEEVPVVYFPLDFWPWVKRALGWIRPRAFVALETELWPNFLHQVYRLGSPLFLANGRISPRSYERYRKIKFFFEPLLNRFAVILVREEEDAQRLISLGAAPSVVRILGNIKFDGLVDQAVESLSLPLRQRLAIQEDTPVWVAGSTRSGEETVLVEVYEQLRVAFPELLFLLAPRHLDRLIEIEAMLRRRGVPYQRYGTLLSGKEPRREKVILVDRMGDLFALYGLATLAFCGASLVPKGGQNILEPAAWGKVVFYGPYMEDFQDARNILEKAGAGFTVRNGEELKEKMVYFLTHPEERRWRGHAGQQALKAQSGVTDKAAEIIAGVVLAKDGVSELSIMERKP